MHHGVLHRYPAGFCRASRSWSTGIPERSCRTADSTMLRFGAQVQWRLSRAAPLEEIAQEMAGHESVCAIVNLRRHAVQLFEALSANCRETESDSLFFLTTDLCPAHRSRIIDTIKSRISNRLPCRVVATQCIEAGVDLDFEVMYRAMAPLEAIIQAAGRCNRNGIFPRRRPGNRLYPGGQAQYLSGSVLSKRGGNCENHVCRR